MILIPESRPDVAKSWVYLGNAGFVGTTTAEDSCRCGTSLMGIQPKAMSQHLAVLFTNWPKV
jgi:hypothetical protein